MKRYTTLLIEKDNRKVLVDKFHFSKELADILHSFDDKYDITFANLIVGSRATILSIFNNWNDSTPQEKKDYEELTLSTFNTYQNNSFPTIRDWLRGRGQTPNPNEGDVDLKN